MARSSSGEAVHAETFRIRVGEGTGEVSAILERPDDARAVYVLGHGAGAGMRHAFMENVSRAFVERGVAVLRYQFPYMECGNRRPDPHPVLFATVRAAVHASLETAPGLPCFAGGRSMGGRMTSMAVAKNVIEDLRGIVFLGFPLHPANRPGTERALHLAQVRVPMLFVQGTRDALAGLELLRPICDSMPERGRLHIVEGADHGFHVLKRSGRSDEEVLREIADAVTGWIFERSAR